MNSGEPSPRLSDSASSGKGKSFAGILAASSGTLIEWYDFMVYAYVASIIAPLFFPTGNDVTELLASFGAFAVGFIGRPLGGIVFGNLGDSIGRKKTLMITVAMMTIPMLGISILPTFDVIGIAAPLLLLLLRFTQGFAVGGEYTGVITYVLEEAPARKRAYVTNLGVSTTANGGTLLAAAIVGALTWTLSSAQMSLFGWRIAFGVGGLFAVTSLFMRTSMEESEEFTESQQLKQLELEDEQAEEAKAPVWESLKNHPKAILIAVALTGFQGIGQYLIVAYLPSYLEGVIGVSHDRAMIVALFVAAFMTFAPPLFGLWSDRMRSRKIPIIASAAAWIVLTYPMFALMGTGNFAEIFVAQVVLVIPLAVSTAAFVAFVGEIFPTEQRYSALSVGYNFGIAIFGGTAPMIGQALIAATGSDLAPSYYLIGVSILIIPLLIAMRETASLTMKQLGHGSVFEAAAVEDTALEEAASTESGTAAAPSKTGGTAADAGAG